jgi:hypothetical protein
MEDNSFAACLQNNHPNLRRKVMTTVLSFHSDSNFTSSMEGTTFTILWPIFPKSTDIVVD